MIDQDEPAFPFGQISEATGQPINGYFAPGMSLRAYFAGQAMQGILAASEQDSFEYEDEDYMHENWVSAVAVSIADALITELNKPKP